MRKTSRSIEKSNRKAAKADRKFDEVIQSADADSNRLQARLLFKEQETNPRIGPLQPRVTYEAPPETCKANLIGAKARVHERIASGLTRRLPALSDRLDMYGQMPRFADRYAQELAARTRLLGEGDLPIELDQSEHTHKAGEHRRNIEGRLVTKRRDIVRERVLARYHERRAAAGTGTGRQSQRRQLAAQREEAYQAAGLKDLEATVGSRRDRRSIRRAAQYATGNLGARATKAEQRRYNRTTTRLDRRQQQAARQRQKAQELRDKERDVRSRTKPTDVSGWM